MAKKSDNSSNDSPKKPKRGWGWGKKKQREIEEFSIATALQGTPPEENTGSSPREIVATTGVTTTGGESTALPILSFRSGPKRPFDLPMRIHRFSFPNEIQDIGD